MLRVEPTEFILSPQWQLQENYVRTSPYRTPDSLFLTLEGREFRVYGISEEEADKEFTEALSPLVEPIVEVKPIKEALDRLIQQEFRRSFFAQLASTLPRRKEIWEPRIEESELLAAINLRYIRAPLQKFAQPLQHKNLLELLENMPEALQLHFAPLRRILEWALNFLQETGTFVSLETAKNRLGEELEKRILKNQPIKWKIPKDKVPYLHRLFEAHLERVPSERGEKIYAQFKEIKDYFLEDDTIPYFLALKDQPWPRVERIKQALRTYFKTQQTRAEEWQGEELLDPVADLEILRYEVTRAALNSLENSCSLAELRIEFLGKGKPTFIGSARDPYTNFAEIWKQIQEEEGPEDFEVVEDC
jgi:hypothetical protein